MDFQNDNGTATKNGAATAKNNVAQNGAAKTAATNGKAQHGNGKPELKPAAQKEEPAKTPEQPKAEEPKKEEPGAEAQPAKEEAKPAEKPELPLEAKLKAISDLNRKSIQRLTLIGRMQELENFEVKLIEENDELENNPYQGCKLIIRDDKGREFVTTTPGLIRMVTQFIFDACDKKLSEIESTIVFPTA